MPQVIDVTDETFETEVTQADTPVAAEFYTQLCPTCKRVTPLFEQLSDDYSGRVKFVKVDIAKAPEIARRLPVLSVPSVLVFKGGQELERVTGYADQAKLVRLIDDAL
jgi:thioredoxin 1